MLNKNLLNEVEEESLNYVIFSNEEFLRFMDDEKFLLKESELEWTYNKLKGICGEDIRKVYYRKIKVD